MIQTTKISNQTIQKWDAEQIEKVGNRLADALAAPEDVSFARGLFKIRLEECLSSCEQAAFVERVLKNASLNRTV